MRIKEHGARLPPPLHPPTADEKGRPSSLLGKIFGPGRRSLCASLRGANQGSEKGSMDRVGLVHSHPYSTFPISFFTAGLISSANSPTPPMIIATVRKSANGAMLSSVPATRPANTFPSDAATNQTPII